MPDSTYQAKVYKTNGGDTQVVASGGVINVETGGALKFNGVDVTSQLAAMGGAGAEQTAVLPLNGIAWHTGNGGANILSWPNPLAGSIVITRLIIASTVVSTGAATVAAGTTVVSKITAADNLIDDFDLTTTAPAIHDSLTGTDTEIKSAILAAGGWVTFTASADPTGFIGNAYISYFPV